MRFSEAADVLGVAVDAPVDEVKRAYRRLALQVCGAGGGAANVRVGSGRAPCYDVAPMRCDVT